MEEINEQFYARAWRTGRSLVVTIPQDVAQVRKIKPRDRIQVLLKAKLNIYNFRFAATSS